VARSAHDPQAVALESEINAVLAQFERDSAGVARALRALPAGAKDVPTSALLAAYRVSHRSAVAAFKRLQAAESADPAKDLALTVVSLYMGHLAAAYRSLAATTSAARQRQRRLADAYAREGRKAALALDRALGCPYGCRGQR
jgi:hypothetical protein